MTELTLTPNTEPHSLGDDRLADRYRKLINTHCDTLSQLSISKLLSHLASITCKERLGDDLGDYQMGDSSEVWLINQFVNHQSRREMIVTALLQRWANPNR